MYCWSYHEQRRAAIGTKCPYCSQVMKWQERPPTRDHVHPRSKGGTDDEANILIVCRQCNNDKADLTLGQFYGHLIATGDPRADVVQRLMEDAAEFSAELGVQLYSDAGLYIAQFTRANRLENRAEIGTVSRSKRFDSVPDSVRQWMKSSEGEKLARTWIVSTVMKKLNISPECWVLASCKSVEVRLFGKSEKFSVHSTDQLEQDVVSVWHPTQLQAAA